MIYYSHFCNLLKTIESIASTNEKIKLFDNFIQNNLVTSEDLLMIKQLFTLQTSGIHTVLSSKRVSLLELSSEDKAEVSTRLSLREAFQFMIAFSKITGHETIKNKIELFKKTFQNEELTTIDFTKRILTGNLRIGLSEKNINKIINKRGVIDNSNATHLSFNLAKILDENTSVTSFLKKAPFYEEYKYDGIRAMIFLDTKSKKVYTRRGEDITEKLLGFSSLQYEGTPLVLDVEIMLPSFFSFSKTLRSKSEKIKDYFFIVFDILEKGKEDLKNLPLNRRRNVLFEILDSFSPVLKDLFKKVPFKEISTASELSIESLKEKIKTIPQEIEGLILKSVSSIYEPGKRSWFKFKKETETIDLIVLSRSKGAGKLKDTYCTFELGVLSNQNKIQFISNVGSGFSEEDLLFINEKLLWNEEKPLEPIIFEIKYQELITSSKNNLGYSLRFPIFNKYRIDLEKPSNINLFLKPKK